MPIAPSDFEWWMWLVFGAAGIALTAIIVSIGEWVEERLSRDFPSWLFLGAATLSIIATAACFLIGIVRLVKWAWRG